MGLAGLRARHYTFLNLFIGCEKRHVNIQGCRVCQWLWVLRNDRIVWGNSRGDDGFVGERD